MTEAGDTCTTDVRTGRGLLATYLSAYDIRALAYNEQNNILHTCVKPHEY